MDEKKCSETFKCDDGKVLKYSQRCDGYPNCLNAEDEEVIIDLNEKFLISNKNASKSGYYKGVHASNVKTKKDLNENCHIWANFIKKITHDTTN